MLVSYFQNTILTFQEFLYFVFVFSLTWLLPLLVMIFSYATIIIVIYRRSKVLTGVNTGKINDSGVVGRSKINTIKITGILVFGFILCWTPYNLMYVW